MKSDNIIWLSQAPSRLSAQQVTSFQLVMTAILTIIEHQTIPPPEVQEAIFNTMLRGLGHLPPEDGGKVA